MLKKSTKQAKRDPETAARVKKIGKVTGLSQRSVRRVIRGDQKNEKVLDAYMLLQEGEEILLKEIEQAFTP